MVLVPLDVAVDELPHGLDHGVPFGVAEVAQVAAGTEVEQHQGEPDLALLAGVLNRTIDQAGDILHDGMVWLNRVVAIDVARPAALAPERRLGALRTNVVTH